jgi:hypothetical protein
MRRSNCELERMLGSYVRDFKRGESPSFYILPLSFILPRKERGTQGVRLIIPYPSPTLFLTSASVFSARGRALSAPL